MMLVLLVLYIAASVTLAYFGNKKELDGHMLYSLHCFLLQLSELYWLF